MNRPGSETSSGVPRFSVPEKVAHHRTFAVRRRGEVVLLRLDLCPAVHEAPGRSAARDSLLPSTKEWEKERDRAAPMCDRGRVRVCTLLVEWSGVQSRL